MATGCMATKISGKLKHHCTLLGILSLFVAVEGVAQEVGLAGVMGNKALLMINGGDPQTVPVGQVLDGVKVLSIQGDQVDTGATMISLGATDARRIGLDFNRGQKALTNTANGQAVVSKMQLDTVQIGDITLHNIDALIHQSEMPMALLGMSFLNRMEMQRDGSTMTLKKRY